MANETDVRVLVLQQRLQSWGLYLGPLDNDPGPSTALAYARALQSGQLRPDEPLSVGLREAVRRRIPLQAKLRGMYGPDPAIVAEDPKRRGACVFMDGGAWQAQNIRTFDVPLLGRLALHRRAAPAFICAWADVRALTTYKPGIASSYCLRHMNWDPAQPLTTHATGFAIDVDLDRDGRWERREDISPECVCALAILESWGIVLGARWKGKNEDGMHTQAARLG